MTKINFIISCIVLPVVILSSCSKPGDSVNPTPPHTDTVIITPPPAPTLDTSVKGFLYMSLDNALTKINLETKSVVWQKYLYHGDHNGMEFNNGYLYHGDYSGLTCYNPVTGNRVWEFGWVSYYSNNTFSRYAFSDSLIFAVSATTAYDVSSLYCLNKRTGTLVWKNKIDTATWALGGYACAPQVDNDKVIVLVRDYSGHVKLVAYNIWTGQRVWDAGINDQLTLNFKVDNGKIYSTGHNVFCYDAATGNLVWQKTIPLAPLYSGLYALTSFIDGNKIIIAGSPTAATCAVLTLDKNTGAILSNQPINKEVGSCMYRDNVFYLGYPDSNYFSLTAYNISDMSAKWTYKHTAYYPQTVTSKNIIITGVDSAVKVLDLNGNLVKRTPAMGTYFGSFIYIDSASNVFPQQWQ